MRVVILRNSSSGRGHSRRAVDELVEALAEARHDPRVLDVQRAPASDEQLRAELADSHALIIAGGDGTVHYAAPIAMESRIPVIHFPTGTENLFAREFGAVRRPSAVLAALKRSSRLQVDIGCCGDRPFTLMASLGFDSCIVERVASARRGAISRATYIRHAAAELLHPRFVPLSVQVDGRRLVADAPGMVVIANSRQYAARLDPAREASMTDGLLDVVFIPTASRIQVIRRGMQVLYGAHLRDPSVPRARGSHIIVVPSAELPLQLDGEHAGVPPALRPLEFTVRPGALTVLTT